MDQKDHITYQKGLKMYEKRQKMEFLYKIRLKMDQKGHITDQKGLKLYEKGKKWNFRTHNTCFLAEFFLAELGGTPHPLTDNHCAQKSLAERGGTAPLRGGGILKFG